VQLVTFSNLSADPQTHGVSTVRFMRKLSKEAKACQRGGKPAALPQYQMLAVSRSEKSVGFSGSCDRDPARREIAIEQHLAVEPVKPHGRAQRVARVERKRNPGTPCPRKDLPRISPRSIRATC